MRVQWGEVGAGVCILLFMAMIVVVGSIGASVLEPIR